jgi:hypothetical protein
MPSGHGGAPPTRYFGDVEPGAALTASRAATVAELRALLSRIRPRELRPVDTRSMVEADGRLTLLMAHHRTGTRLVLIVDDDDLVLIWPGGQQSESAWGSALSNSIEALLVGRNTVTMQRRLRRVIRTATVVWDEDGTRRSLGTLEAPGHVRALLRRLPGRGQTMVVSISFQEPVEFNEPPVAAQ